MSTSAPARDLPELLHQVFGHREFRAHQQVVCEAAASGRDVLLVMPTGAGKSLCYQLPALARGGTALVISPLIALMDDQASKLSELGLKVARIHSGLDREASRQACRDYLSGELDFLFIAPERMRVPGFPEMLAKRKPSLVAIDEAHCISAWGHDFRPDYRTLGGHLPALRPAPIVALTATATPTVQRDIAAQLDLQEPAIFITGFRRENLAVEVVEMSKPERPIFVQKMLKEASARPAIVYAGSRKQAEELAGVLGKHFTTRPYHAGLAPELRERTQVDFLAGKIDVVVATVAFGMGVDKADVRTVVHVALPGSVEAYYQEIGRAGRDGKGSRTVLLHSFGDRRLQEFFLDKSYPAQEELERVARVLTDEFTDVDQLVAKAKMDRDRGASVVDKLLAAGVAQMDFQGQVRGTGATGWQRGYEAQVGARRSQLDKMVAFAEGTGCRMQALVEHFGDTSDRGKMCGRCDFCSPENAQGSTQRQADSDERTGLLKILHALNGGSRSVGKLFTEIGPSAGVRDRKVFDSWLDGLAKAGLVTLVNDTFRADDGRDITYRKAQATHEGHNADDESLETVWLRGVPAPSGKTAAKRKTKAAAVDVDESRWNADQKRLSEELRDWRKGIAAKAKFPTYCVFNDATLRILVEMNPQSVRELEQVKGLGPEKLDKYGPAVLAICRGEATSSDTAGTPSAPRQGSSRKPSTSNSRQIGVERGATASQPEQGSLGNPDIHEARHFPRPVAVAPKPRTEPIELFEFSDAQKLLETRLRDWRKAEAASKGLPSFFILSDTALKGIVAAAPQSLDDLRNVKGIGVEKVQQFGPSVLELCRL